MKTLLLVVGLFMPFLAYAELPLLTRDGTTVWFTGEISKDVAEALSKQLLSGAKTLVVNSTGGDAEAGLTIAKAIIKGKVTVVVDKYCLS